MKKNLLIAILLISTYSFSQSLIDFQDDNFEIKIPEKWSIIPKENIPQLALVAYRKATDKAKVTLNVNIINTSNLSLEKSYSYLLNSLKQAENFELIENGDTNISNQPFKWLIESHTNSNDKTQKMHNYVFITYKNDKTYILTMVAFSEEFDTNKSIFDSISKSFRIK